MIKKGDIYKVIGWTLIAHALTWGNGYAEIELDMKEMKTDVKQPIREA